VLLHTAIFSWLSPHFLIENAGPWALLVVCAIIFAETGLLIGFIFPGDTLLLITGLLTFRHVIHVDIWWVALAIGFAAFVGGESGYFIGRKSGPAIFERKETGIISLASVKRTNAFFAKYGGAAVILARFVPVVRTFAPVAAGVGKMNPRKYSLYNAIGAFLWGGGVVVVGFLLGNIRPVADFVIHYIDLILVGVVLVTLIPAIYHYVSTRIKAAREGDTATDPEVAVDAKED
jgi:membrane-associated protein